MLRRVRSFRTLVARMPRGQCPGTAAAHAPLARNPSIGLAAAGVASTAGVDDVEVVPADLMQDDGWPEAVAGVVQLGLVGP